MNWAPETNKRITLKKKDITWPYDTRSKSTGTCASNHHDLHFNASINGMPHHPYMGIMWGDGRGFVNHALGVGHCHTDQSNTNEENLCLHSKQRSRRKKALVQRNRICGEVAALKVPEGWGLFIIERCKSPPCPTLSPCTGSGAYH